MIITKELKREYLEMSLDDKVRRTKQLVMEWYHQFDGKVYVAFSGGKDSTVLLHIVRQMFPDVPAVFCDTGLEFPEIRDFVKSTDNVVFLKPKLTFKELLDKYGYPIVSKEQSQFIYEYRTGKSEKLKKYRLEGNSAGIGKISEKWKYLLHAPFKISHKCCQITKKDPSKKYEKETDRKPMIGVMAEESHLRMMSYMNGECNAFSAKRPISKPIFFWKEEDIWNYIKLHNVPYSDIYDKGYNRTGCVFCAYGIHNQNPNNFEKLKLSHPKLYDYCMNKLNMKFVLEWYLNPQKHTCKKELTMLEKLKKHFKKKVKNEI